MKVIVEQTIALEHTECRHFIVEVPDRLDGDKVQDWIEEHSEELSQEAYDRDIRFDDQEDAYESADCMEAVAHYNPGSWHDTLEHITLEDDSLPDEPTITI